MANGGGTGRWNDMGGSSFNLRGHAQMIKAGWLATASRDGRWAVWDKYMPSGTPAAHGEAEDRKAAKAMARKVVDALIALEGLEGCRGIPGELK